MPNINIPLPLRIKQPYLPPQPSKHRRERHMDFRQRQIHPNALPRSPAKVKKTLLPVLPFRSQEPCGVEFSRLGKDGRIIVHVQRVHADGGAGRDGPGSERESGIRVHALEPMDGAVGDA